MKLHSIPSKGFAVLFVLLLSTAPRALSLDFFFNQTNNGDFAVGANWQGGNVPFGFGNTFIGSSDLGSPILVPVTAYVNSDLTSLQTGSLFLGQGGSGNATLVISNGGSLQYGLVYIGRDGGAVGVVNQLGGTNQVNTGTFEILSGSSGTGTYNLSGGVLNTIAGGAIAIKVGAAGSGTGYFNMSGGTFNAGSDFSTQQHSLNVGWVAKGEATFSGGTANLTGDLNAGNGSNGLVTISGSALVNTRAVNVGLNAGAANSRLTVSGGTLSVTNGISVANNSVLNVSGGAVTAAGLSIASGSAMTNSGGTLNVSAITNSGTLVVASGGSLSNNTTVNGGGTLTLNSGGAWTGGEIAVNSGGVMRFNGGTGTGTASINAYGGTLDVNGQNLGSGSFANFIARNTGAKLMNSSGTAATIAANNTIWLYTASAEIETVGNLQIDSAIISAAAPEPTGITKTGSATLTLTANNSFTGTVAVNAGVLNLNNSSGGAAASASGVTVASNAVLLLSQSNQVSDAASVSLSGGTIQRASGVSEVFGNLNVSSASFLNFGSGTAGSIEFGTYTRDTGSALLTVQNFFQGNSLVFSQNLVDLGYISSSSAGSFNNGYFAFADGFNTSWNGTDTFTITAIPEPSTHLAAAGLLAVMLWPSRRRLLKDFNFACGWKPRGAAEGAALGLSDKFLAK
jgi:autotransporter-associated beta strand protein